MIDITKEAKDSALAIGIDDFEKIRKGNFYYIDKTLMIKDFIEYISEVTLITRPRRFGKTLNMTMLREFFDITKKSVSIFEGLAIMDTEYANQINTKPVIYVTFKDCSGEKMYDMCITLANAMKEEYLKYEARFKDQVDPESNDFYDFYRTYRMFKKARIEINENEEKVYFFDWHLLQTSLATLIKAVKVFYDQSPLLFIDEYDQPLISAHDFGYREIFSKTFYASFLGLALKGNTYLGRALLTGIQRVAKESIFSKLNNFIVYSVTSKKYASYFGLTESETKAIFEVTGKTFSDDIKRYYDGYMIGGNNFYNPWSILSYLDEGELKPYWVNTSTNSLIKEAIPKADVYFKEAFEQLILDGEVEESVNLEASFVELEESATLWGLLINSGYLTITKEYRSSFKRIRIPNEEVKEEIRKIVARYTKISESRLNELFNALFEARMDHFLKVYQKLVYDYLSVHDIKKQGEQVLPEASYHNFFLGMAISTEGMYESTSNLEVGEGRGDVIMTSRQPSLRPHIIIEFKRGENVEKLKQEALDQVFEKKYYVKLRGKVLCVGVSHNKKKCELVYQEIFIDEYGAVK